MKAVIVPCDVLLVALGIGLIGLWLQAARAAAAAKSGLSGQDVGLELLELLAAE
ncbi:hypothetical protein LCGC14_1784970 [marine sediment metagenome]|uniref:Uncharacterized protein n=1 Tax=marine sediment metagenome TaxID=412755 RepID=A0A0F9JTY7_9ZZZZ